LRLGVELLIGSPLAVVAAFVVHAFFLPSLLVLSVVSVAITGVVTITAAVAAVVVVATRMREAVWQVL